jgi:ribosomal protein S17E
MLKKTAENSRRVLEHYQNKLEKDLKYERNKRILRKTIRKSTN